MKFFVFHIKEHILVYLTVFFATWLFFFHLDYTSLSSWDEAWYGAIAQNIVHTGDFMNLQFNGEVFYDHPPMGFWLMAVVMKIFGIHEFSVRLTSVILGIGSSILIYLLTYELFKKKVIGFAAAMILNTCVWYVIRVRSGNLDAIFLFFYILTLYAAQLSTRNFWWFLVCMASFGALILSKTLVGFSSIILIIWLLLPVFPTILKRRENILLLLTGLLCAFAIIAPWYIHNITMYPQFFKHHFVHIGMRDRQLGQAFFIKWQWELPLFYLHMGVRKWYKLWLLGISIHIVSLLYKSFKNIYNFFQKKNKSSVFKNILLLHHELFLILWNTVILVPFLMTDQTHIWHLIPAYAPLAVITAYALYTLCVDFPHWVYVSFLKHYSFLKPVFTIKILSAVFVLGIMSIMALQVKGFYSEVFPAGRYTVDEVDILKLAKNYKGQIFIDRDFIPIAVFYTDRVVREYTRESTDIDTIKRVFDENENVVLVIRNGVLENYQKAKLPFMLKEKNNSFSIITE